MSVYIFFPFILDDFHQPALAIESEVVHPKLNYFGRFDALTVHVPSKKVVLIDWKASTQKISTEIVDEEDALQVAAYVGALNHDPKYPYQIENAMVVYVDHFGKKPILIHIDKNQLHKYWEMWLDRYSAYHNRQRVFKIWDDTDQRAFKIWDPEVIEELSELFIEHYETTRFIYKVMETDNGEGLIRVPNPDY